MYCSATPAADHTDCPSSVECFHGVFEKSADLTAAVVAVAMPGPIMAPTMGETLRDLVGPGRVVGFRTESGSLYEATIYTDTLSVRGAWGHRVQLHKIVDDRPVLAAEGIAKGAHDPNRNVWGILVTDAQGRTLKTSAVTAAWLAFDATIKAAPVEPTYGMCLSCGAIETALNKATGTRDLSHMGESDAYPTGHGCELCD